MSSVETPTGVVGAEHQTTLLPPISLPIQEAEAQEGKQAAGSSEAPLFPYLTYQEYLAELKDINPAFEWLQFFQHTPAVPNSRALLVDIIENTLVQKGVNRETLLSRPRHLQLRLVLLCFEEIWGLDRNCLDDICWALDLNPFEIWAIFDHDYSHSENPFDVSMLDTRETPSPRGVLSQTLSMNFSCDQYVLNRLSSLLIPALSHGDVPTVVLFCLQHDREYSPPRRPDFRPTMRHRLDPKRKILATMCDHYVTEIMSQRKNWIANAAQNPMQLLLPYIRLILDRAIQDFERSRYHSLNILDPKLGEIWDQHLGDEEEVYFDAHILVERLSTSLSSLQNFLLQHRIPRTPEIGQIIADSTNLIHEATRLRDAMKDRVNRRAAILSLEESRKSIKMADSVRSLTQLAFVFIPLNFATSIYGANIQAFGSGYVPIWALIVTVLLLGICTGLGAWLWTERKTFLRYVSQPATRLRLVALIAIIRSPAIATILFLYALCHTQVDTDKTLRALCLEYFHLLKKWGSPSNLFKSNPMKFLPAPPEVPFYKAFWPNRLHEVNQYVSEEGWWDDRFYKPWIRHRRRQEAKKAQEENSKAASENGV